MDSRFYTPEHRALQDEFDTRRMADLMESHIAHMHRRQKAETSKYVPQTGCQTPVPAWKRIDLVQEALPMRDQGRADALGGLITMDQYGEKLMAGDA